MYKLSDIALIMPLRQDSTETTLRKIWKTTSNSNTKESITTQDLNMDGEYMKFLKEISKKNALVKESTEAIIITGGISPYSVALMARRQMELDVSNRDIRLIIAIHYLSIY